MHKFSELTEAGSGTPIFVNPWLVRAIRQGRPDATDIIFDGGHSIAVTERADAVAKMLAKARKVW